jgi:hypothetical protein
MFDPDSKGAADDVDSFSWSSQPRDFELKFEHVNFK